MISPYLRKLITVVRPYFSTEEIQKTFRLLSPLIRKYWKSYAVLIALMVLDIAVILGYASFFGKITDAAIHGDLNRIKSLVLVGLLLTVVGIASNFMSIYFDTIAINAVKKDLKDMLFHHILRLPESQTSSVHSGELLSRFSNDIHSVDSVIGSSLIEFVRLPFIYLAVFVYLFQINALLCLISVLIAPAAVISSMLFGVLLRRNSKEIHELYGQINSILNETFQGFQLIRSFTLQMLFYQKHKQCNHQLYELELQNAKLQGWFSAGGQLISSLSFLVSICLGAYFVSTAAMTVGALLTFVNLVNHLVYPLTDLASKWAGFQRAVSALERVLQILDKEPDSMRLPAYTLPKKTVKKISFQHVHFGYEKENPLFSDLTLELPANKTIALVGPSGAGKSSFFTLLQGFYKPDFGQVMIDNVSSDEMDVAVWRSMIAHVPQDTFLFSGTFRENLYLSRPEITEAEMIRAAVSACIHDFIQSQPQGYDTEIGERGIKLSGGQKQRLAIARAILKDAPILLLDEATSALDTETESLVQQALDQATKGRTTIIIAHRLTTIQQADLIIVMNQGSVVQTGTHAELIAQPGLYRRMHTISDEQRFTARLG